MFNRKAAIQKLEETTQQVTEQLTQDGQTTANYGEQLAAAIQSYATMTADFIEDIGHQMVTTADGHYSESKALADNIRKCAELEAQRTQDFVQRMKELGSAMARARETFEKVTGIEIGRAITSPDREAASEERRTAILAKLSDLQ